MKKQMLKIGLCLWVLVISISMGFAQQRPVTGEPVTVTGKIYYMDRTGGYYLKSEKPSTVLIIVNQDPKMLGALKESGKTVTVEGKLTGGADLLFIEKIDGKPYIGSHVIK